VFYRSPTLSLFFFQAEDGIRDGHVTGVQTCALPICRRSPPRRRTPPGRRTARRSDSSGRTRRHPCRIAARRSHRSCGARGRLRSATPPAREPRSPAAAASLPALSQAVDQGLERVGRGVTVEPLAVHVERRRAADAERFALLQARLDAAGIALAVHAGVVLIEVDAGGFREVAKQRSRILAGLGPLVIAEQLVV